MQKVPLFILLRQQKACPQPDSVHPNLASWYISHCSAPSEPEHTPGSIYKDVLAFV